MSTTSAGIHHPLRVVITDRDPRQSSAEKGLVEGEELSHRHAKGGSDPPEILERRVTLAAFDAAEVGHVYSSAVGDFFLGETALKAHSTNVGAEGSDKGVHSNLTRMKLPSCYGADTLWSHRL